MKKLPAAFVLTIIGALLFITSIHAVELNISGNGAGSDNSVNINSSNTTSVNQSNQGSVNNDVNAGANTGGNNTDNGSVKTGDANIFVKIKNLFNSNSAEVDCCPPGVTPTPTVYDPSDPAPTTNEVGGPGGASTGTSTSSNNNTTSSQGAVLGLSATAGEGKDELWFYIAGFLSIVAGGALMRQPTKFHA